MVYCSIDFVPNLGAVAARHHYVVFIKGKKVSYSNLRCVSHYLASLYVFVLELILHCSLHFYKTLPTSWISCLLLTIYLCVVYTTCEKCLIKSVMFIFNFISVWAVMWDRYIYRDTHTFTYSKPKIWGGGFCNVCNKLFIIVHNIHKNLMSNYTLTDLEKIFSTFNWAKVERM